MKSPICRPSMNKLLGVLLIVYLQRSQQLQQKELSFVLSNNAKQRRPKKRVPWSSVDSMLNNRQFRRMFRMTRECFELLCEKIKLSVGEKKFKSEAYIELYLNHPGNLYHANCATTGGYISGEIKLAISLRILAGGDPLDIAVIYLIYRQIIARQYYMKLLKNGLFPLKLAILT